MISFKPRVGKAKTGLTSGGFTVVIPYFYYLFCYLLLIKLILDLYMIFFNKKITLFLGIISVNPPEVRPVFALPTRGLKLITLPT